MTLSYGFYNSVSQDRLYDALQISSIFDGIITDGVYASIGDKLMVFENTGMQVSVGSGRAWFNHTWSYNDNDVIITLDTADALLPRIDVIYLEVNSESGVRANSINKLTGTPASSPVAPSLTNTATIHQYPLAHIYVHANITQILQSRITNKVGTTDCPFVTGPLSTITTNELLAQWEAEFMDWFDAMKDQLTTDAAGNLQAQINAIIGDLNPPLITLLALKTHTHISGNGSPIVANGLADGAVNSTSKLANDIVDDSKVGYRVPQFYRRQGGDTAIWSLGGDYNFVPSAVRMQAGVKEMPIGGMSGSVTVTFPVPFSNAPIVASLLVLFSQGVVHMNQITVGASNFTFQWTSTVNEQLAEPIRWSWMAIGPE